MYYKVIKDDKVIDVLDNIVYVKWQKKNKINVLCKASEAQGILSSDNEVIWHERGLHKFPDDAPKYDTVKLVEIDRYEYDQLKIFSCRTLEEVLDEYTLRLINEGVI